MAEYISARDAVLRELESAEHALKGAEQSYAQAETALHSAQDRAERAWDGRATNARNVDRLKKALDVLEGTDAV